VKVTTITQLEPGASMAGATGQLEP
jgi:hypothetical protein